MKAFQLVAMLALCVALILSQLASRSQRKAIKNMTVLIENQNSLLENRGRQVDQAQAGWKTCLNMVDGMLAENRKMRSVVESYSGILGLE